MKNLHNFVKSNFIQLNKVYKHYKGSYYKPVQIAFHHDEELNNQIYHAIVIYHKCDENGIFKSIRDEDGNIIANQCFYSDLERWNRNFLLFNKK